MIVKNYQDGKIIILSKPFDSRPKILNSFYFLSFFASGTLFLRALIVDSPKMIGTIIDVIAVIVFYIAAYRFANKALLTEKIFINTSELQLIQQGLFKSNQISFDIQNISNFRHLAKPELTKHVLAGETFDYLGFQTGQEVINEMHGDKRVAFDYAGRTINFGENIYMWDFEQLEALLYDASGNDLEYEDTPEHIDPKDGTLR
jgi:hypothetical protein